MKTSLSIITPIYNEAQGLRELVDRLSAVLHEHERAEIIAVDDGSKDTSAAVLGDIAARNPLLKVILLARNYGQTTALAAGIAHAQNDIVVLIDSDLENNPDDIAKVIQPILDDTADVVSGWRKARWADARFIRKLPSRLANALISYVTGVSLHDYGCTLKAYRRPFIQGVPLYGEMHRFIPAYAARVGARVTEVSVGFTPRKYGTSNYGFSRTMRVLPDLLFFYFFSRFLQRPMHFFGYMAFASFAVAAVSLVLAVGLRIFAHISLIQTPLPILSGMSVLSGIQFFGFGLLAEILMRTYFESQHKTTYNIRKTINI
jgi:glycosyltransferase involved in cell wall biosynthesis